MTEANNEEKAASNKDRWRERIAEQERGGLSVRRYCEAQGIGQHLFYYWRKRLREQQQPIVSRWWREDRRGRRLRAKRVWN